MARKTKETERSASIREFLRSRGMRTYWEVEEGKNRVSYWTNGAGKAALLSEHTNQEGQWDSWDLYRQLESDNHIAKTLTSLDAYLEFDFWDKEGKAAESAKVTA